MELNNQPSFKLNVGLVLKSVQFLQKGWQLCSICCVFALALDCMSVTQGLPLSLKVTHTEYNIIAPFGNTFGRVQSN